MNWYEVNALLTASGDVVTFSYILRALDEGEEWSIEYAGVPLALDDDLRVDYKNDIKESSSMSISTQPHDEPPANHTLTEVATTSDNTISKEAFLAEDDAVEIKLLFSGGGHMVEKKPATPQSEFAHLPRQVMLQQHDDIDVFTPDGLVKWQMKAMTKVSGPQPKLGKYLGFKGNSMVTQTNGRKSMSIARQAR